MAFEFQAWLFVLAGFWLCACVQGDGWEQPELIDIGNPDVNLGESNGAFVIRIAEEIKDSNDNGIKLNYKGKKADLTVSSPLSSLVLDISETGDGIFLVVKDSPDFEGLGNFGDITISDNEFSSITAHLDLKNIDDNPPQAILVQPTCNIKENSLDITPDCTIIVKDADGCSSTTDFEITGQDGTFSMILLAGSPSNYPNCLDEPSEQGTNSTFKLNLLQKLDFEKVRSYFLNINSIDKGNNVGSQLQMVVQVEDVADMPPTWVQILSTKTVNEEEENTVIHVEAKDQDVGIDAKICYEMQILEEDLNDDEKACFSINESKGDINIGKIYRDDWQRNSYSLFLTAHECDDPTSFVNGTLVLQVLDSINKMFKYVVDGSTDNKFPKVTIDENEVITFENTVTVTDPDEGNAGTFTAKLDNAKFMVLPGKGLKSATFVIQGLAPLDYENEKEREFTVNLVIEEVQDKSHTATIPITVQVNNLNDNSPVFLNTDVTDKALHVKIREDVDTGTLITVQATDADGDTVTYGMVAYSGLEINQDRGEISLTKLVFDFETQPTVVLQVMAYDENQMHTTYVTLKVEVDDVNDTPPLIRVESQSTPEIAEDAETGSEVAVTIQVSDRDLTADLEASIDWETSTGTKNNQQVNKTLFEGWFAVTMDKDDVKIKVAGELKWDVIDTIQLKIVATDLNTEKNLKSSNTTVSIIIKDVNNNAPDFGANCGATQPKLQFQENSPEKLVIGTVTATDADGPGFNTVIYTLEDANEMRIQISPDKGLISTGSQSVDYEVDQTITVVIVATDDTVDKLSNRCPIIIEIIDVNDETPQGTAEPTNKFTIPENTGNQFKIAHVEGSDKDITPNFTEIRYALNTFQDYFTLIETDHGVDVVVNFKSEDKYFDYDSDVKKYELSVYLTDYPDDPTGGRLQLSSVTPITVELSDVNDNAPKLSSVSEGNCFFSVPESTQGDAPLTGDSKLVATDADSNENSWISYAITDVECDLETMKTCPTDKNELFKVSGNTENVTQNVKADIRSNKTLTNKYGEYLVTVVATDHGDPVLSSDPQKYRFCIVDENNNSPVIDYPQRIVIHQDEVTGQLIDDSTGNEIPLINATDDDFGKNGEVGFTLEPNDVFSLRPQGVNQAKLVLNAGVDLNQIPETLVAINACDSPADGDPKCSKQDLTIKPLTKTEFEPEFPVGSFEKMLRENDTAASVILPKASDRNNDDSDDTEVEPQAIYYFIISGEPEDYEDYFTLEAENPLLSLKKPLDASICDQYTLSVQTTNKPDLPHPNPGSASLLSVNITVEDINDKFPIFDKEMYTISMSSGDAGRSLLTLHAVDPDRYDTVTYGIDLSSIDASHLDATVDTADMFSVEANTGAVKINTYPDKATRGSVTFTASATDGIHKTNIQVSVYVVSTQYLIPIQFANTEAQVATYSNEIANKLSEVFQANCISGPAAGGTDYATIRVHFEDENSVPIEPTSTALISVTNNVTAMEDLKTYLLNNYKLVLVKFGTDAVKDDAPEEINTALIAVSAVLAALLVASAIFFFIKHRTLSKHVDRLTKASTETSVEAKGTILPNTNQNIGIGSNPMYNAEVSHDLDSISTTSSRDSGLIGIEENPEFDRFYNEIQQKAKATGTEMDDFLRENPQLRGLQITNDADFGY